MSATSAKIENIDIRRDFVRTVRVANTMCRSFQSTGYRSAKMRQEERTLITRYRSERRGKPDPGGGSFRFLRCPPVGWLSDTVWERNDGNDSPAIGSAEKGIGRRSTAIARCRSLILNSFTSDFELAVFQPRRRLRRNDMGDSPLFWKKSVTAGVTRATPRACEETRVISRRECCEMFGV